MTLTSLLERWVVLVVGASAGLGAGISRGQVADIADMVVLLPSDRSGVVTGSVIDRDQNIQGCFD